MGHDTHPIAERLKNKLTEADETLREVHRLRLLSVRIAARRLNMSVKTARRWIHAGKLYAIRYPSGRYRVPESEVEKINRGQKGTNEPTDRST